MIKYNTRINILILSYLIFIGCKDNEVPVSIVYGDPSNEMVYNLKIIDLSIDKKIVNVVGNTFGEIYLDPSGSYLVYVPFASFEQDEVSVMVGQETIVKVRFISSKLNNSCKTYAPFYSIVVPKNSDPIDQVINIDLCDTGLSKSKYVLSSGKDITPINGLTLYGTSSRIGIRFAPEKDFIGVGELLYDVGFYHGDQNPSATQFDPGKYDVFVSGFIRVIVTE